MRKIHSLLRRKVAAVLRHSPPGHSSKRSAFSFQLSVFPLAEPLESRIAPAAIVAHWIGGSGNWSDPAHWDIGAVPNNAGGNTYSAVIDLAGSDPFVTIDQNISIAGLTNSEVIHIAAGVTNLSTLLANTGAIDVTGSATLNLTGAFTAPAFGSLSANGGIIKVSATLDLAGGNMQIAGTNGWQLVGGGTIKGGTITASGGAGLVLPSGSGTLDDVILGADATLGNGYVLTVKNGLTLDNAKLTLASTQGNLATQVVFRDTQTLGGTGEVLFGGTEDANYVVAQRGVADAIVTISPGITVHGAKGGFFSNTFANDRFINQGTISADTAGKTISLNMGAVINQGSLLAPAGTLDLTGSFTTASLGTLGVTGGTANIRGTLDNTGTTLAFTPATGSWQLVGGGTIKGGTITASGGAGLLLPSGSGTLDDVTLSADLTLGNGYVLTVKNGLTLNNAKLTLASTQGNLGTQVVFLDTQTLGGTGEVIFAGTEDANYLVAQRGVAAAIVTIGSGITVHGTKSGFFTNTFADDRFINQGTIRADTAGKTISLNMGALTNQGSLLAPAGALNLTGDFTTASLGTLSVTGGTANIQGILDNTGATLAFTPATGSWQLAGGTIKGGTITGSGGAGLLLPGGSGTLDGVTLGADVTLGNGYTLTVKNGLVLNNAKLTLASTQGNLGTQVVFLDTQTLGGTGEVIFAGTEDANYLVAQRGVAAAIVTIGSGITVHGTKSGFFTNTFADDRFINQGTIRADTAGKTISLNMGAATFSNSGTLSASNGGTLIVSNSLTVSGTGTLSGSSTGVISISGSLLGSTTNAASYRPQGTVRLIGVGTSIAPQLLEAMSQDGGNVAAGFTNNFDYGTLSIGSNNYVKLVDQSDNATGVGAEAVYADSVTVSAGSTLDLNGLHLYVRASQVSGTVVGGSIDQIPDSGTLTLGATTPGAISQAGELDEWTFFGRGGKTVTVLVNPGAAGSPAPVAPQLAWANVQLLDGNNNVIASAADTSAGGVLTLNNIVLPAEGTYKIRINAAAGHTASTGNYLVAAWDVTPNVRSLNLDQTAAGGITTPFGLDQWNFTAIPGQQVQFDLINTSASGLVFTLSGPAGYTAFTDLSGDSPLITLPASGAYTLTAHGTAGATGNYAFALKQTSQTDLALGTTYNGTLAGSGQAQLFRINVPAAEPMVIHLTDPNSADHNEVYAKFGSPPTRADYDVRFTSSASANQNLLVPRATAGTWYFLVYAESVATPGTFAFVANTSSIVLTGVTPHQYGASAGVIFTLTGAGLGQGDVVSLVSGGGTVVRTASSAEADSFTQLTGTFDLTGVPQGDYTVRVTSPSGAIDQLPGAFHVAAAGQGHLTTNLVLPPALGNHAIATLYIEYANTGTAAIPAPIIQLSSAKPNVRPILTLNQSDLTTGFWTGNLPDGFSTSITILASGAQPGVLNPGEHVRVPVYYAGLIQPWNSATVPLGLSVITANDTRSMNWEGQTYVSGLDYVLIQDFGFHDPFAHRAEGVSESGLVPSLIRKFNEIVPWINGAPPTDDQIHAYLGDSGNYGYVSGSVITNNKDFFELYHNFHGLRGSDIFEEPGVLQNRPASIDPTAWVTIVGNLEQRVGDTLGDWVSSLDDQAVYLSRQGLSVTDVGDLWGFMVQQAAGLSAVPVLDSAIDAFVQAPGLSLSLGRSFANNIASHYHSGMFGNGWSSNWDAKLSVGSDNKVSIDPGTGSPITYDPDTRTAGKYFSPPGVTSTLVKLADGTFDLRSADGLVTHFAANGQLAFLRDTNGNETDAAYNPAGQLVSLTSSSGQFLTLAYNGAGHLASITDSAGRATSYAYDASNQHLTQVTAYDGRVTGYTYSASGASTNALTSVALPDGTHEFFTYDVSGRLSSTSRDGGAQRVTYGYDNAGMVSITDATGATAKEFFDQHGMIVKTQDALGNIAAATYDKAFNLTGLTDPTGQSTSYHYNSNGSLTSYTDALGHTTHFDYGALNRVTGLTDANGNQTSYAYDPSGNLLSTTYANGSVEHTGYNPLGEASSFVNRRGQTSTYTYNAAGQIGTENFSDGTHLAFSYNAAGDLITATDASGDISFTYDAGDRITKVTYPDGKFLAFTYDAAGRRTSMTDQDGFKTQYVYDGMGELWKLLDGSGNAIVTYTYDAVGRIANKVNGNGTHTIYQYDAAGNVLHLINYAPDNSINSRFDYAYNDLGRRTTMATIDGTWTYTYDGIGELTHAVFASSNAAIANQDLAYAYDAVGNRTQTVINGVTTAYVSNKLNEYTSVGGSAYSYDADGNLAFDGSKQYTYDSLNRLIAVSGSEGTWFYQYDSLGNRSIATHNSDITRYLVDPTGLANVVGEFSGSGAAARYAYGFGLVSRSDATSSRFYYDFDGIGSTAGMTGAGGTYVNSYSYSPFGGTLNALQSIPNTFGFVGQFGINADGNAQFMRGRYYSSDLGRFLTQDPLGINAGDANLYRYVSNAPTLLIDPTGEGGRSGRPNTSRPPAAWLPPNVTPSHDSIPAGVGPGGAAVIGGDIFGMLNWWGDRINPRPFPFPGPTDPRDVDPCRYQPCFKQAPDFVPVWPGYGDFDILDPDPLNQYPQRYGRPVTLPRVPPPNPSDTQIPAAVDPNDIIGPSGYGSTNFINGDSLLPYRVDFENDARATAPAQVVTITNQLPSTLDWSTFRLTEVGFGDKILGIPANAQHYQTAVPMTYNGKTFSVLVEAGIHSATGQVYATFQSLDALTQLPPDVLTGFLPQEDGTGRGQGHISYTVEAKANVTTGTEIRNVALIIFDQNEAIATDQIDPHNPSLGRDLNKQALVTIDRGAPTSQVQGLTATQAATQFTVQWSGQDDANGSDIASYDVYVSDNGGPFTLFLDHTTNTSEVFTGVNGHTCGFFSVARDNVGNTAALPTTAQTTTLVNDFTSPTLLSVVSRKTHGSAGTFDLPLSLGATATVEPRLNGPNTLILTFSESFQAVSGELAASNFAITNGLIDSAFINGNTMTITLTGIVDQTLMSVALSGLVDLAGNALAGGSTVNVNALYGDVSQSGSVSVGDLQGVKNHLLEAVDASNYLFDLNGSGTISVSDMQAAKNNLLHSVAVPIPAPLAADQSEASAADGIAAATPSLAAVSFVGPLCVTAGVDAASKSGQPPITNGGATAAKLVPSSWVIADVIPAASWKTASAEIQPTSHKDAIAHGTQHIDNFVRALVASQSMAEHRAASTSLKMFNRPSAETVANAIGSFHFLMHSESVHDEPRELTTRSSLDEQSPPDMPLIMSHILPFDSMSNLRKETR